MIICTLIFGSFAAVAPLQRDAHLLAIEREVFNKIVYASSSQRESLDSERLALEKRAASPKASLQEVYRAVLFEDYFCWRYYAAGGIKSTKFDLMQTYQRLRKRPENRLGNHLESPSFEDKQVAYLCMPIRKQEASDEKDIALLKESDPTCLSVRLADIDEHNGPLSTLKTVTECDAIAQQFPSLVGVWFARGMAHYGYGVNSKDPKVTAKELKIARGYFHDNIKGTGCTKEQFDTPYNMIEMIDQYFANPSHRS